MSSDRSLTMLSIIAHQLYTNISRGVESCILSTKRLRKPLWLSLSSLTSADSEENNRFRTALNEIFIISPFSSSIYAEIINPNSEKIVVSVERLISQILYSFKTFENYSSQYAFFKRIKQLNYLLFLDLWNSLNCSLKLKFLKKYVSSLIDCIFLISNSFIKYQNLFNFCSFLWHRVSFFLHFLEKNCNRFVCKIFYIFWFYPVFYS